MTLQQLSWILVVFFISVSMIVESAKAESIDVVEIEAVFENGDNYAAVSCDVSGPAIDLNINMKKKTTVAHQLRFGDLGEWIRGEKIEILDARLDLFYQDEYWTKINYHVAASRSLDGTVENIANKPVSVVHIIGDKWPTVKKTPRPSWVSFPIDSETIRLWTEDESMNHGLVLHVPRVNRGRDQKLVDLELDRLSAGPFFVGFRSCKNPGDKKTPRLVVRYRVHGNAPPSPPALTKISGLQNIYKQSTIVWPESNDPNKGDQVHYEFEAGFTKDGNINWSNATVELNGTKALWMSEVDRDRFYPSSPVAENEKKLWYRIRAVDSSGDASRWSVMGPYIVTDKVWSVWGTHGNHKIWPDIDPPQLHGIPIKIKAARNEWEPFQVVVKGNTELTELKIISSTLTDVKGNEIAAPVIFQQHYLPITSTANTKYGHLGMVPDALVPLVHPETGLATGGKYGGDVFKLKPGEHQAFLLDVFVKKATPPGIYTGTVKVTARDVDAVILPVELEVFDFTLASPKRLLATFQLSRADVRQSHRVKERNKLPKKQLMALAHEYESMMHEHYINNWSPITGFNYGLNGVQVAIRNGKVSVDWSRFDDLVATYMDGSAYKDKVPAQSLFVPYWIPVKKAKGDGWARKVNMHNYQNIDLDLFAQYIKEVQRHMKEKGWLDRAYVFYFDEPFISAWKYEAFIKTSKIIREEAPELKIMITDGFKGPDGYKEKSFISEPIEDFVDVWDPVTFQVSSPKLADYYRKRKAEGKFDIWCQTLANANPRRAVINLFPEYDMPFHRMWGVMSWNFGFQGIEWWQTIVWWDGKARERLDPWTNPKAFPGFRQPLNSDGRLFFSGTPDAIGGPDIPISTLRMKAIREAVEDYEYLYILEQLGGMKDFSLDSLHTTDKKRAGAMKSPMPMGKGPWHWWEGDPDMFMRAREEIARLIQKYNKHQ